MPVITAKNVSIIFALATIAFCVATIVLAVQKADLENELQDLKDTLDLISVPSTQTSTSTTSTTTSGSVDPGKPSTPNNPDPTTTTVPTTSSSTITTPSSSSTSTTRAPGPTPPQENPNFPTLPPGLVDPNAILFRLPTDLRPIKYRLYWHPNLKTRTCEGTVSIQVEVDKETNLIVLHAKDIEIDGISILNMNGRMRIRVKEFNLSAERELLIIELEELLHMATPYVVSISFRCDLDGLSGMYASSYLDDDAAKR